MEMYVWHLYTAGSTDGLYIDAGAWTVLKRPYRPMLGDLIAPDYLDGFGYIGLERVNNVVLISNAYRDDADGAPFHFNVYTTPVPIEPNYSNAEGGFSLGVWGHEGELETLAAHAANQYMVFGEHFDLSEEEREKIRRILAEQIDALKYNRDGLEGNNE